MVRLRLFGSCRQRVLYRAVFQRIRTLLAFCKLLLYEEQEPIIADSIHLCWFAQVSEERWYQALVKVVESLATMGRQLRTRLTDGGEKDNLWATVAFAYDQTDQ